MKPLDRSAEWVLWLFGLAVIADFLSLVFELQQRSLLADLSAGRPVTLEQAQTSDDHLVFAYLAQGVLFLGGGLAFLIWFRRAYENLPRFGPRKLRFKRAWATWSWFVPILSLFRPKQIANDIWRGSSAFEGERALEEQSSVPSLLNSWWALVIASGVVVQIWAEDKDTLEQQRTAALQSAFADIVFIASTIATIVVVRAITARQQGAQKALSAAAESSWRTPSYPESP